MRFAEYANQVWDIPINYENPEETALLGIQVTEEYFETLGMPTSIQVIVGNITRPEDLRASLIITGILLDEPAIIDNVLKYGHRDHITHLVV